MEGFHWTHAAAAGVSGAVALTAVHQAAQLFTVDAPRMDVVGRRAIAAGLERTHHDVPDAVAIDEAGLTDDLTEMGLRDRQLEELARSAMREARRR